MIYALLSLSFLCLGLARERGLLIFLVLISCLPFSNSLSTYFYQLGLYSYDYYFFGLLISIATKDLHKRNNLLKTPKWATLALSIICIYSIIAIFSNITIDLYYLRDLRPAIFATELIAASMLLKSKRKLLSSKQILTLITLAGITNLIWLSLSIFGVMSSDDQYYTTNNFKYFDASTYISALYIIYYFSQNKNQHHSLVISSLKTMQTVALIASLLSIIFSGYRILAFATILSATVAATKSPKKLMIILMVFSISAITFIYISEYFGATRVTDGLSASGIFEQLTTRYEPALNVINTFNPMNYLFGNGFGTVFDITWFEYRSLDTKNNFVDSAYITFYAKYGIVGFLYLILITLSLLSIAPKAIARSLSAYLIILFIAYAISYQPASAGIIIGCVMTRILQLNSDSANKK